MTSNLAMIERRPHAARLGHQVSAAMVACVVSKSELDRRSRLGVAPAPEAELGLAESSGGRHVVEMRARRMREARIRFIGHPDFDDSTATAEILGPMPGHVGGGTSPGKGRVRDILPLSDADFQDSKFLTREQEVHAFRQMNFLKYQAAQLKEAINPSQARSADLDRIEELLRQAGAIRNRIIRSYVGLVISIVRKCAGPCQDFLDLVAEGNMSLIKASERFDFARGARFSTYATWAIINNFAGRSRRERSRRVRFATGREGLLQSLADHRESGRVDAMDREPSREIVSSMLDCLTDREQTIVVRRFGLAGDKQTLAQIGRELGISKERVRQLEFRAIKKLRTLADAQRFGPIDESASGGDYGQDG
jgi:RNA polymerase primary sigma factor